MAIKRFVKKAVKKAAGAAKKRYFKGKGYAKPNLATMVRDLALVKRSLNVEKKNIISSVTTNTAIGQVLANDGLSGQQIFDVTPAIVQGIGYNQMTGNSVKLVSMALFGQIKQQSATRHPMRCKVTLFQVVGTPQVPATMLSNATLYERNPLTTCVDYNSQRNVNYFRDYKILGTKYVYLMPAPVSGELILQNFKFVMKLSHHLKWDNNTTTLTAGQIMLHVSSDSGNSSAVTASTLTTIPITAVSTGASIQFYTKYYYVDN